MPSPRAVSRFLVVVGLTTMISYGSSTTGASGTPASALMKPPSTATTAPPISAAARGVGPNAPIVATEVSAIDATRNRVGGDATIADVALTDSGFVAVGRALVNFHCCAAASWTSADGRTWTRSPSSGALRNGVMSSVAVVGSRIVAVGVDESTRSGAVWTSTNGRTWRRAASGTQFTSTWLTRVVADGNRFAATGIRYRGPVDERDPTDKVIGSRLYVSTTGASWTYVSGSSSILVGALVNALLSLQNGLIAGGDFGWPLGQQYAAAWSSPLNKRWLPAQDLPTVRGSAVTGLGTVGDRVIALGTNGAAYSPIADAGDPGSLAGGRQWHPVDDPAIAAGTFCVSAVSVGSPIAEGLNGLVAIGFRCSDRTPLMAWSQDGVHWSTAPIDFHDEEPVPTALVRGPDGLIIVGYTRFAADGDPLVWNALDPTAG